MATSMIVQQGGRAMKLRTVAPGEVELSLVAILQYMVSAALVAAPPNWLAGNGTALLILANHPHLTFMAKSAWAIIFFSAGMLCFQAIVRPAISTRKWAWQFVIPLWACWLTGLYFPLIMGLPTNVIMLSAVTVLVLQWLVTRLLVPLDSYWYSRIVPVNGQRQGEGLLSVDDPRGSRDELAA